MDSNTNKPARSKTFTVTAAFICAIAAFSSCYLIEFILQKYDIDPAIPGRFCRAVIGFAAFILLGGQKWLRFDMKAIGKSWLISLPMILFDVYSRISPYIWQFEDGIPPGVWKRIAYCAALFLCVGLNEEFIFRGLLFGGMLYWIGKKKNGILTSAIAASLIFGYCHVFLDIDYTNIYSVLTSLFKTLQTGLFGFVMCYCCLKYKSIWGAVTIHFFIDFYLRLVIFLQEIDTSNNYTKIDRESAIASIQSNAASIIVSLIPAVICFINFRKLKPTDVPFGDEGFEQ